jgi:hypothetical protein
VFSREMPSSVSREVRWRFLKAEREEEVKRDPNKRRDETDVEAEKVSRSAIQLITSEGEEQKKSITLICSIQMSGKWVQSWAAV